MICDRGPKFDFNNSITLFKVPQSNVLQNPSFPTHADGTQKLLFITVLYHFFCDMLWGSQDRNKTNPEVPYCKMLEVVRQQRAVFVYLEGQEMAGCMQKGLPSEFLLGTLDQ